MILLLYETRAALRSCIFQTFFFTIQPWTTLMYTRLARNMSAVENRLYDLWWHNVKGLIYHCTADYPQRFPDAHDHRLAGREVLRPRQPLSRLKSAVKSSYVYMYNVLCIVTEDQKHSLFYRLQPFHQCPRDH